MITNQLTLIVAVQFVRTQTVSPKTLLFSQIWLTGLRRLDDFSDIVEPVMLTVKIFERTKKLMVASAWQLQAVAAAGSGSQYVRFNFPGRANMSDSIFLGEPICQI